MASTIKIKNSSTAGAAPTASDLVQGELAVNVTDKRIYTENASGTVVELGTNPSVPVTFPDGSASAPSVTNDGDTNTGVFFPAADTVGITTGGTERVRVDSSGNVGIGTSSPGKKLEISSSGSDQLRIGYGSLGAGYTYDIGRETTYGFLRFYGNQTTATGYIFSGVDGERMRIDSSGNVGIGETAPSSYAKLRVAQASNTLGAIYATAASGQNGNAFLFGITGVTNGYAINNDGSNNIQHIWNGTGGAERARIASGGQFCVNTTNTNGKLNVSGDVFWFSQSSGAGNSTLKWSSSTGQMTYDTSSRLVKENIVDSPYGLAEILRLKSRKYFRTDDQRDEIGLVADEVQEVLPEFVPLSPKSLLTKNDADTELIPSGVYYEKLTSVLIKAIQEQQALITQLQADVAALKGN